MMAAVAEAAPKVVSPTATTGAAGGTVLVARLTGRALGNAAAREAGRAGARMIRTMTPVVAEAPVAAEGPVATATGLGTTMVVEMTGVEMTAGTMGMSRMLSS